MSIMTRSVVQVLDPQRSYDPAIVHRMAFTDAASRAKKHQEASAALKQARSLVVEHKLHFMQAHCVYTGEGSIFLSSQHHGTSAVQAIPLLYITP